MVLCIHCRMGRKAQHLASAAHRRNCPVNFDFPPVSAPVKTSGRFLLPEATPSMVHRSSLPVREAALMLQVESVKTAPAHLPAKPNMEGQHSAGEVEHSARYSCIMQCRQADACKLTRLVTER
jgi:hypothetical protein